MPRRIEIELTSHTDGAWTWRAAGAKQPKGSLTADLVPERASVGDVFRAEVESGLDGLEVIGLLVKQAKPDEKLANRIEVMGAPQRGPDVSVTFASGSRRRREGADRPGRRDGAGRRGDAGRRDSAGRREGREGEGRRDGTRRDPGPRRRPSEDATERRSEADTHRNALVARRERKPTLSTVHRNAMLATLGPEQLPVAEQLLRGGIPAVRQAIAEQRQAQGGAPANADQLLVIAEQLLPVVNLANWKDRATTAQAAGKELRLRELRAVVAASRTVTLDEEGRALSKALQDALEHRVTALRDDWVGRITSALEAGRVLDALRIATRPPEVATRLPADLAVKITEAAGAAMTADLAPEEWLALLDAVLESPVRRTVKPGGIPAVPQVQEAARHAAGLVPELAKLLGLRIPPPPPRRSPSRRPPLTPTGGGGSAVSL
jgi:hypothetical protein